MTSDPASGSEPRVPAQPTESPAPAALPAAAGPDLSAAHLTVPIPVPVPPSAFRPPEPAPPAWDPGARSRAQPRLPAAEAPSDAPAARHDRRGRRVGSRRAAAPLKPHRHPAVALPAVVLFGLLAAFFAWQAADPLWLAVGRGVDGTATVTRCQPTDPPVPAEPTDAPGSTYRCVTFTPPDHAFHAVDVTLLGAGNPASRTEGVSLPARMVAPDGDRAYAAGPVGLHLRWSIGLLLVLACGAGIAWATGATRLDERRSRRRAVLLSFAGPLLLTVGFLTAAL